MITKTLNNGVEMPALGYGVFQITDQLECEKCVSDAIKTGYRLLDTASAYANEEAVGRAIESSAVSRKELFVTTKVWISDSGYENTKTSFKRSLENLRLDYLDLYLIHRPFGDYYGSWRAMEELYKEGLIHAIGVCNFTMDRLVDLVCHSEIKPAVNQIETHPFHQQNDMRTIMEELDVIHESWAPFAEGKNGLFTNETLLSIAAKYKKSVGQVVLRWHVQRGSIAIPKSVHLNRIQENFDIWDFALSNDDMCAIAAMDTNTGVFVNQITNPETVKYWCSIGTANTNKMNF